MRPSGKAGGLKQVAESEDVPTVEDERAEVCFRDLSLRSKAGTSMYFRIRFNRGDRYSKSATVGSDMKAWVSSSCMSLKVER